MSVVVMDVDPARLRKLKAQLRIGGFTRAAQHLDRDVTVLPAERKDAWSQDQPPATLVIDVLHDEYVAWLLTPNGDEERVLVATENTCILQRVPLPRRGNPRPATRTVQYSLYLTPEEHADWTRRADARETSLADYIRLAVGYYNTHHPVNL